jgi:dipeptidyl aminopeptidase/acylaminoacyl peptidase
MKTAVHILLGIILVALVLPLVLLLANTHPPRYPLHIPPSDFGAAYEPVSFMTGDGITLKGWLIKPSRQKHHLAAIIICHGVGANRSDFTDLAVHLSRRGYLVLAFDFRAHGASEGRRTSLGYHEQKDIEAALAYLRSHPEVDRDRIGIYGFSMGGVAAILTASTGRAFSAVIADSAYANLRDQIRHVIRGFYHLPAFPFLDLSVVAYEIYFRVGVRDVDPERVIAGLWPIPVFIIAGKGDDLIPVENGRRLFRAAKEPKELWVIPVSGHGGTVAAAGREYENRVGEFFDRYLQDRSPGALRDRI